MAKNGGAIRPLAQFLERVRLAGSPSSTTQSGAENPFIAAAMQGPEWVLQDNRFGTQKEALPIAILMSYIYCQLRSQITAKLWNGIPITHVTVRGFLLSRKPIAELTPTYCRTDMGAFYSSHFGPERQRVCQCLEICPDNIVGARARPRRLWASPWCLASEY